MSRRYLALLSLLITLMFGATARANDAGFDGWLENFKASAKEQGISPQVVDDALTGLTANDDVIALDGKQPENKITLARYLKNTISKRRIEKGQQMLREYRDTLAQISRRYGVQPKYIVALWAIESDFGDHKGDFSVVQSLATLAYEGRRAEFFSKELIAALKILDAEHLHSDALTGSWAGAMGDCQFMPSTYLSYAADGNGDGRRDIWNTPPDVFASIANYLHALGWNAQQGWGHAANFPDSLAEGDIGLTQSHSADYWRKAGLTYRTADDEVDGAPRGKTELYAIYSSTPEDGAYLVTDNYKALLQWNRSRYFATAVGTLADAIGERP